jgi:hypothetical protein
VADPVATTRRCNRRSIVGRLYARKSMPLRSRMRANSASISSVAGGSAAAGFTGELGEQLAHPIDVGDDIDGVRRE